MQSKCMKRGHVVGMIGYGVLLEMETDGGKRVSAPMPTHWTALSPLEGT